jgi:hypothetical protein
MRSFCSSFTALLLSVAINHTSAQFKPLRAFVPQNYSILAHASGDINIDGNKDLVIILRNRWENMNYDTTRPLLLLAGNGKGQYRLLARNDSVVLCLGCGGVHGDPFVGVTVKNGFFAVRHFGGSGWRWTRGIAFKYDLRRHAFFLHRDSGWSWHLSDPSKRTEIVSRQRDFDQVPFAEFSYNTVFRQQ